MGPRHKEVCPQSSPNGPSHPKSSWLHQRLPIQVVLGALALFTLACGPIGTGSRSASDRVAIITRLPTLTRTPLPTLTPTANPNSANLAIAAQSTGTAAALPASASSATFAQTPAAASEGTSAESPSSTRADTVITTSSGTAASPPIAVVTGVPLPTNAPTETPAPAPLSETPGWSFSGVRVYPDQNAEGLLLYGEMINNTGASQGLDLVTGTFYDAQGQVIANSDSTYDYRPVSMRGSRRNVAAGNGAAHPGCAAAGS